MTCTSIHQHFTRSHSQTSPFFVYFFLVCVQYYSYMEVDKWQKMGKAWEHLSHNVDVRWTWGGWSLATNACAINLRANFLTSQVEHL